MDQIIVQPNLVYEILSFLDSNAFHAFCFTSVRVGKLTLTHELTRKLCQPHKIKFKTDSFLKRKKMTHDPLTEASMFGDVGIVNELILRGYKQGVRNTSALTFAARHGKSQVVDRLLQETWVNPSYNRNEAICLACEYGHLPVLNSLLNHRIWVNPAAGTNTPIRRACQNGHLGVVERLLQCERVDPGQPGCYAFWWACVNNHPKVVELLLRDGRVDPTERGDELILQICARGYYEVLVLILEDGQLNPAINKNGAIKTAQKNGHAPLVARLLQDERVLKSLSPDLLQEMCVFLESIKG